MDFANMSDAELESLASGETSTNFAEMSDAELEAIASGEKAPVAEPTPPVAEPTPPVAEPTGFGSKVSAFADAVEESIISPAVSNISLGLDIATRSAQEDAKIRAAERKRMSKDEKDRAAGEELFKQIETTEEKAKRRAAERLVTGEPVGELEATGIGLQLAGISMVKPFMEVAKYTNEDSAFVNDTLNHYLKTIDRRLKSDETGKTAYGIAKGIEFIPQVAASFLSKASIPALMAVEFFMGAGYESTSVYPDPDKPGEFRNANIVDMLMAGSFGSMIVGGGAVTTSGYKAYKEAGGFVPMFAGKNVRDILTTDAERMLDMVDVTKLASKGINLDNYLVNKGSDLLGSGATTSKGINVWENKEAANKFYNINKRLIELSDESMDLIYKAQKPIDVMSWEQLNSTQQVIKTNVEKLSKAYTDIVNEAYDGAAKALNTVEHIKIPSTNMVEKIQDIFNVTPTSVTTAVKPLLDKTATKLGMPASKVAKVYSDYDAALADLMSARGAYGSATTPLAQKKAKTLMTRAQSKYDALSRQKKRLDKADYEFTLGSLEEFRKLINHKIYVPGQNVSMSDKMALKGLHDIRAMIDDTMNASIGSSKELFEASLPLMQARNLAATKASKFGMSSDNTFMMDLIIKGDDATITRILKNPEEGPKALKFIGDTFGKDSEAFQASARTYIEMKMTGLSATGVAEAVQQTGSAYSARLADPARFAAAYNSLSNADIKMIRSVYGDEVGSQINGLKKFSASYAQHIKFLEDKSVPLGTKEIWTSGVATAILDGMSFYGKKLLGKAVAGAPLTRMVTGAATAGAITALGDDNDGTDMIASMAAGAIAGHYGGRVIRSILEPDIKKILRYINGGKHIKAQEAMKELTKVIKDQGGTYINKDLTVKEALGKYPNRFKADLDSVTDAVTRETAKVGIGAGIGAGAVVANDRNASREEVIGGAAAGAAASQLPKLFK